MKKILSLFTLLFAFFGMAWAQEFIVLGIKEVPTQITQPNAVETGYYLLKQVNDNHDCAGGNGVGYIKFNNETVGTHATSVGTSTSPTEVNYVWYVEKKENGNITISTANKKASWQLPTRTTHVKPLVDYAQRSELVMVTEEPTPLKNEQTSAPKANSCYLRNTDGTSYVHFSGNDLGSWTSAGSNSTFMVEFYKLDVNQHLNKHDLNDKERAILKLKETLVLAESYKDSYDGSWRLGDEVNKYSLPEGKEKFLEVYNAGKNMADHPDGQETAQQVTEKDNELKTLIGKLTINQPKNGVFYRLRCIGTGQNTNKYILPTIKDNRLETKNEKHNAALFYCQDVANGKKTLLAFNNGQYFGNAGGNNNFAYIAVGNDNNKDFAFSEGGQKGCYKIQQGGRYIYGASDKMDSGNTPNNNGYYWWLEEVTPLPVTVSAAGWATLYAPVALTIPATEGLTVYTAAVEGNTLKLKALNGTIPANTPVLIEANAATYNFTIEYNTAAEAQTTGLKGTLETINKPADKTIYTLQKPAAANNEIGFYKYNGQTLQGFRAYGEDLLSTTSTAEGLIFDKGDVTAIENVEINDGKQSVIYDLNGRRVEKMLKGIYIVNGKKVIK